MILFYTPNLDESEIFLEEDEFQHCVHVLRHRENDLVQVTDGKGNFAEARITRLFKRKAQLEILGIERKEFKKSTCILAVAPPKSKNRWELILEKSVECGVDLIIPFISSHSERVKLNVLRANKIIRSAALQSKRIRHPRLHNLINFQEVIDYAKSEDAQGLLCHFEEHHSQLSVVALKGTKQILLVGPEGDFSDDELENARQADFCFVKISPHRLRTETAAFLAVGILEARYQALGLG